MVDRRLSLWMYLSLAMLTFFVPSGLARLLAPAAGIAYPAVQSANLIINEYLADPPDGLAGDANGDGARDSSQDEFVEVINVGAAPLDVGGFTISDATSIRFTFPPGKTIPAGDAAVVFGGGHPTGPFGNCAANGLVFAAGGSGLSLNNTGDTITVKNNSGATVASLTFGSAEGNANQSITRSPDISGAFVPHSTAAGSGGSLFSPGTRVDGFPFAIPLPVITSISPTESIAGTGPVTLTVNGNNFQSGAQVLVNGVGMASAFISAHQLTATLPASVTNTPGSYSISVQNPDASISNSVAFTVTAPIILSAIGINEFLADPPDGPAGDANGDGTRDSSQDEFVEIINRTASPIDVGGFTVSDAAQVRFTFPPGAVIPATEVAVIFGGGSPRGDFGNAASSGLVFTAALSLNNTGDTITVKDPAGNVVESVVYGSAEGGANQSLNRKPDIVGTTFATHSSISDSGGRLFSPGTRTNGMPFTVAPHISAIFPESAPLGNTPLLLSVRGSGFEPGSIIFVDTVPIDTTRLSDDEVTGIVPVTISGVAGPHLVRVLTQGGVRSNAAVLTIIPPPPLLRSVRPGFVVLGSGNVSLFADGAGFDSSAIILIDGSGVATRVVSQQEVIGTVPASRLSTPGTRRVRVRNGDGQESNELTFEVILPGPRITSLIPGQTIAGGPDFSLSVRGSSFTSRSVVLLDKTQLPTIFVSANELQADIPARFVSEVGLRAITVETEGSTSNDAGLRVVAVAPLIRTLEPRAVVEGSKDVAITVTGERFKPGAVVRVVEDSPPGVALQTEFINEGQLEARLPAAFTRRAGRLMLRVDNPDFGISSGVVFDVFIKDPLVINEYLADPPDGDAGDANGDGSRNSSQDEFVEIVNRTSEPKDLSGWKLSDSDAVRHIFGPGTVVPPFEAVVVFGGGHPTGRFGNATENNLVFVASSGGLSLNNTGDTLKLEDGSGTVVQEISFGPNEGSANQSLNRQPDVDGSVFERHSTVDSSGRPYSPGSKADGEAFTFKPAIDRVSPPSIRALSASFSLLITGGNFLPGAQIQFGETLLDAVYLSGNEIQATVSAQLVAAGGAVDIRVRNPKGETSRSVIFLIVDDPPEVNSVSPRKTSTGAEDLEVTLTGERFQRGGRITVNGEAVDAKYMTAEGTPHLLAVLPGRFFKQSGELELRVINADGNLSNGTALVVENGPLITRLSRTRIRAARGETELTVGGVAFTPGGVLYADDTMLPTAVISDTVMRAIIPAQFTDKPGTLTLQVHSADGGRSNKVVIRVVE